MSSKEVKQSQSQRNTQQVNISSDEHGMISQITCRYCTSDKINIYIYKGTIKNLICCHFDNGNCVTQYGKPCIVIKNAEFFKKHTLQALVNVLERKSILSKEELLEELTVLEKTICSEGGIPN